MSISLLLAQWGTPANCDTGAATHGNCKSFDLLRLDLETKTQIGMQKVKTFAITVLQLLCHNLRVYPNETLSQTFSPNILANAQKYFQIKLIWACLLLGSLFQPLSTIFLNEYSIIGTVTLQNDWSHSLNYLEKVVVSPQ